MQRRSSALRAESLPSAPVHHLGVVLAVNGRECQVDCAGIVLHAVLAAHLPLVQPSQRVAVLQVDGAAPLVMAAWPDEQSSAEPLFDGALTPDETELLYAHASDCGACCAASGTTSATMPCSSIRRRWPRNCRCRRRGRNSS